MSFGKRRSRVLDGEELFKYYYLTMGDARSYNKLQQWATNRWGPNPETGKVWTTGALWQSAWRWALDNLDYAKKIYRDVAYDYFLKVTKAVNDAAEWSEDVFEKEWLETVAQHAKTCMTPPQYKRFLNKYPQMRPYEVF